MTRKLSLIIGIAVTALAFGIPTAFGEGQLGGPADGVAYFYANERATLDFGSVTSRSRRRDPGEAPNGGPT